MIKVLIVDDSAFMRKALSLLLEKDPEIKVVGLAGDGLEALEAIPKYDPDVITLDIEMPRMDGLTCLQNIMRDMPRPVLMVSSLTTDGAEATLKAMDAGALDFIPKPQSKVTLDIIYLEQELQEKVKEVAKRKRYMAARSSVKIPPKPAGVFLPRPSIVPTGTSTTSPMASTAPPVQELKLIPGKPQYRDLVAIGVSTGGPPAVQKILTALPEKFPAPIIIAQHMPASFTGPFARRLDGLCRISVKEGEDQERLKPGVAYVCPGGKHIRVAGRGMGRYIQISEEPKSALYKPSVTELFDSAAKSQAGSTIGVMLTGMGSDGLEGAKLFKNSGGRLLAQSEATCVVYGMPKAVVDANLADAIVDIDGMAAAILESLYKI